MTTPNITQFSDGIEVRAPMAPGYETILTPEAVAFVAALNRRFNVQRLALLERIIREGSDETKRLSGEVAELRRRLDARDGRLDDLEQRIAAVEKRLGIRS